MAAVEPRAAPSANACPSGWAATFEPLRETPVLERDGLTEPVIMCGRARRGHAAIAPDVGREETAHGLRKVGGLEARRVHHVVERIRHFRGRLVPLVAVSGQRLQHDLIELRRTQGIEQRRRRHLARAHALDGLHVVLALEQARPVRISCSTIPVAKMSMRRSISFDTVCSGAMYANLPLSVPLLVSSTASPPSAFAIPKSRIFTAPSYDSITFDGETSRWIMPSDLAVLGRELVRVGQRPAHLAPDVRHQLGPRRPHARPQRAHGFGQIVAAHVLHGHEVLVVHRAELENLDDIGVRQLGRDLGLVDEHLGERRIVRQVRQDALDDEGSLKARWALDARLEHIGHTSPTDAFKQRVLAEWNRLRKRYPHGVTVDCILKCPSFAPSVASNAQEHFDFCLICGVKLPTSRRTCASVPVVNRRRGGI
jgi:hypothetical protein